MSEPDGSGDRFKAVIFDFDYTLADSSLGVIECTNYALGRMGLPVRSPETIRAKIGISLSETYEALAPEEGRRRFVEFERLFSQRGYEVMVVGTRLFDSTKPAVEALLAGGLCLGIVSTKYRRRIEAVLRRDGLTHAFAIVVGAEDVTAPKPDPSGLVMALRELELAADEVLFVGDSVVDAETARRAGAPFAAVLSGVTPREVLQAYEPRAILEDLAALWGLIL